MCIDFDIAVQADTFDEVRQLLSEAIETYVEVANEETPEVRDRLLARRSPFRVRLQFALMFLMSLFKGRDHDNSDDQTLVSMNCPA